MDGVVPAVAAADRVGAADIVRRGIQRCCSCPCGWWRRSDGSAEIKHVEAHLLQTGQPADDIGRKCRADRVVAAVERGNSSYQAANSAWGRSTSNEMAGLRRQTNSRSPASCMTSRRSRVSKMSALSSVEASESHFKALAMTLLSLPVTSLWARSRRARASAISLATSAPAARFNVDVARECSVPVDPGFNGDFVTSDPFRMDCCAPPVVIHERAWAARPVSSVALRQSSSTPSVS